jgi:hypothetical protein
VTRRLLAALLLGTAIAAQQGPAKPPEPPPFQEFPAHDAATSRLVFRACDGDGDDRLSIFETGRSLDAFGNTRDLEPFRRVDADRDGFLDWPEFDRRFAEIVLHGGRLRARTPNPVPPPRNEAQLLLAEQVLAAIDENRDGRAAATELAPLTRVPPLPNTIAGLLREYDQDRSGDLDVDELAVAATRLPAPAAGTASRGEGGGTLPPELAAHDRNRNGILERDEFAGMLARIDPGLTRWVDRILAGADQNRSGALGPAEILRATTRSR